MTPEIVGAVESYVQENVFDTLLLLPTESVNLPDATLIVYVAFPDGVSVAVYVVPEPEKLDKEPPLIVISLAIKFVVLSLDVKVSEIVESFDVSPLLTVAVSYTHLTLPTTHCV